MNPKTAYCFQKGWKSDSVLDFQKHGKPDRVVGNDKTGGLRWRKFLVLVFIKNVRDENPGRTLAQIEEAISSKCAELLSK